MRFKLFVFLFLSIVTTQSCAEKSSDSKFNSDFNLYKKFISNFTGGLVSSQSDLKIVLNFNKSEWKANQILDPSIFKISPSVKGKVVALNANTISFVPEKKLDQNTQYQVTFNLDQIIEVPENLKKFNYTIQTIKQDFIVNVLDLQSYSKAYQYLNLEVKTADFIDLNEAQKLVQAKFKNANLKVRLNKNLSTSNHVRLVIDSIPRGLEDENLEIIYDGKPLQIDQKGNIDFKILGKNNFGIIKVNIPENDTQSLNINFSDPLKKGQNLEGLIAVENNSNLRFSIQGNVLKVFFEKDQKGDLLLEIFQGIESEDGKKLQKTYTEKLSFDQAKPEVRFISTGTILPTTSHLKLNFEAVNLKAVDVKIFKIYKNNVLQYLQENDFSTQYSLRKVGQPIARKTILLQQNNLTDYGKWNTYAIQLDELIATEPGAIYNVEINFKKEYSLLKCLENSNEELATQDEDEIINEDDVNYSEQNNLYDDNYYNYESYDWREREDPCTPSYYFDKNIRTNILASNIGVIVKRGENKSYFVAVNNILTTAPIAHATVELYNYQQQLLASTKTNSDGFANFDLNKFAYFAIVSHENQTTYVKLDDGLSLSVSNFDVSGNILQKGLKGFIYGERGVWRPGDNIHLGFIFNDHANALPINHPIKFELKNPRGKIEFQKVINSTQLNHYAITIPTDQDAPTGNWEAIVSVGGAKFYKSIKIETIKPNRLKIKTNFENRVLKSNQENPIAMEVNWLHGAVAKNLKMDVQAKFMKQTTSFKNFTNFNFDDQTANFKSKEINLFEGNLDQYGKIQFNINPNIDATAPGILKVSMLTKVHEEGGDVSTDVATTTYSPYKNYVGIKTPELNKYGLLETRKSNKFEIATVNQDGTPIAIRDLKVSIYKINWRWWWDQSEDQLSNFSNSQSATSYKNMLVSTNSSGKGNFSITVPDEDWGRYLIRIEDPIGGHVTTQTVLIDYPYWTGINRPNDPTSATMLVFTSDKKSYKVGETAKISFPSSKGSRALVSIENGSQIIQSIWVNTTANETKVEIPINSKMTPNVYINITLLQPHERSLNDAPIRLYGVIPIEVNDVKTQLQPQISMPNTLIPEQKFNVKVSEKTGKPMTYTIAVVDEGLLDLTKYKTPNPWQSFYAKEALGVKTWDIYDLVIGAYGGRINQIFSIGGDEDLGAGNTKKANRFKPVVLYYGPFELKANHSKNHQLILPKYIGSVKTMVVAANATTSAYGSTEKITPVKSPLMILASLPRKVSPGEKVTLPITIFATEKNIKNVQIKVETTGATHLSGKSSQSISFAQPEEKMTYFNLNVGEKLGISKIKITAISGDYKASYDLEVDVTNPNPVTHLYQDLVLNPNKTTAVAFENFGIVGSNKTALEVSSFPTIDLSRKLDYLLTYPHGCLEQITSTAFPQLYLSDLMDLSASQKSEIQKNITKAIKEIGSLQLPNGGFKYWPNQQVADDWATSYAGHFLIEAEKKGYVLPIQFKNKWIQYQKSQAKNWRINQQNDFAQAYRLYTLACAENPDLASMNRLRETAQISNETKLRLAATYALIGQKSIATALAANSKIEIENKYTYYGSPERNLAMSLETFVILNQKQKAFQAATILANKMSKAQWMSTQTTAYCLMAMSKFAKTNGAKGIHISYKQGAKSEQIQSKKALVSKNLNSQKGRNSVTISNKANNTLYVRVVTSGILPMGEEIQKSNQLSSQINFYNTKNQPIDIQKIQQGTEIIASITVKNTSNYSVQNLALTHIIPSGFEIVNSRHTQYGEKFNNIANYIDIRDDRTNFYFDLKSQESKTFKVALNASYLGRYYAPGLQVEAMYDNNYLSRTKGQWIEITN